MARSITSTQRVRQFAVIALSSSALLTPAAAWADCTGTSPTFTCSGSSASFSNTTDNNITVNVSSGATVAAPLVASGTGNTLSNSGTISNSSAIYGIQMGDGATIANSGTITSSSASSGAGAISVGANSTVTNDGTMTAYAGTPLVTFGTSGTFTNKSDAAAALTGNIVFGINTGTDRAHFNNYSTSYGLTGSVTASGNITAYNNGIWTGNFVQTAKGLNSSDGNVAVIFTNDTSGTFTGILNTGDQTTLVNNGTMYLYSGSAIGTLGTYTSSVTNAGTLYVGTTSAPAQLAINGNFTQTSTGTLNIAIIPAGSAATTAGTTYSQLYTSGTATLAGTLNLNVVAGFYPTGTVFKVIDAAQGISGNFSTVSGTSLPFVTFNNLGVVTVGGTEQAYEFQAVHTTNYATSLQALGVTDANRLAVASGLNPLIATATNNTGGNEASLLGAVDVLDLAGAKAFLDSLSPEGYFAYAQALRDQANAFARQVDLRMTDQNSNHPEDGWWLSTMGQFDFASTASTAGGYRTRDKLFGITGGYDFSGPTHVLGLAAHISWDSLHYALTSLSGHNRDIGVALYGAKNLGNLRFSGQVAYNFGHLGATKTITIGSSTLTADASAGEHLLKATGQIGYDLKLGGYTLEPFVGIDFNKGKINGFTETNAGAANLTVLPINADRTDALFGGAITRNYGKFRPYAKVMYRERVNGNSANVVTAYMDGNTDTTFAVTALGTGKGEIDTNAGINWVFDDAGALFVGYQGTIRDHYNSHGINLGIRLEF